MEYLKRYRAFSGLEWFIVAFFSLGLGYILFINSSGEAYTILLLLASWCIIDLLEIKNRVKIDLSFFRVTAKSNRILYIKIVFLEILSLKSAFTVLSLLYLSMTSSFELLLFAIIIFILQSLIVIILYHIAYRYISIAVIVRYLLLVPFIILIIGRNYIQELSMNKIYSINYLLVISTVFIFILSPFLIFKMLQHSPFIKNEYLERVKNSKWSW